MEWLRAIEEKLDIPALEPLPNLVGLLKENGNGDGHNGNGHPGYFLRKTTTRSKPSAQTITKATLTPRRSGVKNGTGVGVEVGCFSRVGAILVGEGLRVGLAEGVGLLAPTTTVGKIVAVREGPRTFNFCPI
jgi:hypothetical protein